MERELEIHIALCPDPTGAEEDGGDVHREGGGGDAGRRWQAGGRARLPERLRQGRPHGAAAGHPVPLGLLQVWFLALRHLCSMSSPAFSPDSTGILA